MATVSDEARPVLRVINPDATPEEIAAIVAVLSAAASGGEPEPPKRRPSAWSAPHRKMRETLPHGAGGWRGSGLPR